MMKRSGFKVKVYMRPQKVPVLALTRPCYDGPTEMRGSVAKHDYVRSPALMRACGKIVCQHCGNSGACGAHSNWGWGKGMSKKADDNRIAALCSTCHHAIDQGNNLSEEQRKRLWFDAHLRTVHLLCGLRLWPADVPVPAIAIYPW